MPNGVLKEASSNPDAIVSLSVPPDFRMPDTIAFTMATPTTEPMQGGS